MDFYKKAVKAMDMSTAEFIGGIPLSEIERVMRELSVTFPESYKAFLSNFGGGSAGGKIIFGITGNDEDDLMIATQMARSAGLSDKFIIISYIQGDMYCLDTSKMQDGECPVVRLSEDYEVTDTVSKSFGQFLYDYLSAR